MQPLGRGRPQGPPAARPRRPAAGHAPGGHALPPPDARPRHTVPTAPPPKGGSLYVVMEHCRYGELDAFVRYRAAAGRPFSEDEVMFM
jgi:hypothetical protein